MIRKNALIINKLGLHARAAAKLVQTASEFSSEITIKYNSKETSGKSIMGIMMLAASKGNTIEVIAVGDDETAAIDAVVTLIADRFGEAE